MFYTLQFICHSQLFDYINKYVSRHAKGHILTLFNIYSIKQNHKTNQLTKLPPDVSFVVLPDFAQVYVFQ